ncbi:Odorant receptor [Camponotus japonicus]
MHAEMEEYYFINKFFLSRIGAWPYQHKVLKILLPCFLTIVQYSVIATEIILLHDTWGNVDIAVESVIIITPIVGASTKLINIVANNDKFRHLLRLMNEHWSIFNSESERYILKYYANIGQKVTKYYAVYCCTILVLYLLIPLSPRILDIVIPLNESRPLKYVYQAEYRVDKDKYYYPILFHAYMSSVITVGIVLSIDTMYIICVLHACSLFTAISHRLENIVGQTDVKIDENEQIRTRTHYHLSIERYDSINEDYRELMICLRKHQLALEHVRILDSTFTHAMFILLSLNVLIMSVIGLQLINKLGHTEEVIRYICVTVGAFTHLVCMCFPGQLLIDRSAEIFEKAYCSQWYTFSIKSRRLLKILLYRSLVPCTLTAGKMFVMSMTMCSSVMQTAMSYFTTLGSLK